MRHVVPNNVDYYDLGNAVERRDPHYTGGQLEQFLYGNRIDRLTAALEKLCEILERRK